MAVGLAGAAGIGQGLIQGVQTYLQTQNMLENQAVAKKLANAQSVDAYAKLLDAGGTDLANQFAPSLDLPQTQPGGLLPNGLVPNGFLPKTPAPSSDAPSDAPSSQSNSPNSNVGTAQAPKGLAPSAPFMSTEPQAPVQGLMPQDPQGAIRSAMAMPKAYRGLILAPLQAQAESQAKLATPQGQAEYRKQLADAKNAEMDPFNKGATDFKATRDTFETAADAYGKLMNVTSDNSPKNMQSALFQVIKLDMPRQAVRMGSLEAMEEDPQIQERWGNKIQSALTGTKMDVSIEDLKRVGTNLYRSNSAEFRAAQADERKNAAARGVQNPTYVNSTYADQMDALASKTASQLPPYQPPGVGQALAPIAHKAAGLISPERQTLPAAGLMPPPNMTFEQFKAWRRGNAGQ